MKFKIPACKIPLDHAQHRLYNALLPGAILAVIMRIAISILFFSEEVNFMGFYNLVGAVFSIIMLYLVYSGYLKLTLFSATFEMFVASTLANYYVGWETDFDLYIFLIIPLFFLYSKWKSWEYITFIVLVVGGYVFEYFMFKGEIPHAKLDAHLVDLWAATNFGLAFGAILCILLYSNFALKSLDFNLQRAYKKLEAKHEEKEVMLKEIHHRVKNNLHVVNGLLELQKHDLPDPRIREIFNDTQRRIISIAAIHEKMYGTEDLRYIDLEEYFQKLITDIIRTYTDQKVAFDFQCDSVQLDIDKLAPLAFLINEVITNSIKYGIKELEKPGIHCSFHLSEDLQQLIIIIGDNGAGFDPDLFRKPSTFGMDLVTSFASDLQAKIQYNRSEGKSEYLIELPLTKEMEEAHDQV